jgi:nicotinate phosphoribosyltransferase
VVKVFRSGQEASVANYYYNTTMLRSLLIQEDEIGLLTDLYEITMSAAYWSHSLNQQTTFELYFRRLPRNRSYILAAGLEQALHYLTSFRFTAESISYLRSLEVFKHVEKGFWDFLGELRFTGDVRAMKEGTAVFPQEPLLQITAPLIEAQIAETYLLSVMNMQSMIATKASRIATAAQGVPCVEFGGRRAHGPQAALYAARASYIGGCIGTSNTLAGQMCGIPVFGTAAHSFIMAFSTELDSFKAFQNVFPNDSILLIDTYDTLAAAEKIKELVNVKAVRIDSGDLAGLARKVRTILDRNKMQNVKIFLSGDLNEYKIHDLLKDDVPVDYFGVGTELATSYDDPAMSGVYKMVEMQSDAGIVPKIKTSPEKPSYPGKKQVFRFETDGFYMRDLIALENEPAPQHGIPLLEDVIKNGALVRELPTIEDSRKFAHDNLSHLSNEFHDLKKAAQYEINLSEKLIDLHKRIAGEIAPH